MGIGDPSKIYYTEIAKVTPGQGDVIEVHHIKKYGAPSTNSGKPALDLMDKISGPPDEAHRLLLERDIKYKLNNTQNQKDLSVNTLSVYSEAEIKYLTSKEGLDWIAKDIIKNKCKKQNTTQTKDYMKKLLDDIKDYNPDIAPICGMLITMCETVNHQKQQQTHSKRKGGKHGPGKGHVQPNRGRPNTRRRRPN